MAALHVTVRPATYSVPPRRDVQNAPRTLFPSANDQRTPIFMHQRKPRCTVVHQPLQLHEHINSAQDVLLGVPRAQAYLCSEGTAARAPWQRRRRCARTGCSAAPGGGATIAPIHGTSRRTGTGVPAELRPRQRNTCSQSCRVDNNRVQVASPPKKLLLRPRAVFYFPVKLGRQQVYLEYWP